MFPGSWVNMRGLLHKRGDAALQQWGTIEFYGTLPLLHTPRDFDLHFLPDHPLGYPPKEGLRGQTERELIEGVPYCVWAQLTRPSVRGACSRAALSVPVAIFSQRVTRFRNAFRNELETLAV